MNLSDKSLRRRVITSCLRKLAGGYNVSNSRAENEALRAALEQYDAVGKRYVRELEKRGLEFEPAYAAQKEIRNLREQLRARGVTFRNAQASLSVGFLSPACVECTGNRGSETFSTTFKCHRDCYFCFNRNVADYDKFVREGCPWEENLERSSAENIELACIGLTGGEPLLDFENTIRFFERVGATFPQAHKRMYTAGDLLTESMAERLRDVGLDEIRFSIKNDDSPEMQQRVLNAMEIARRSINTVMVEMPVIPGTMDQMKSLFTSFERIGIDGINLLEFCFPFCRWQDFKQRGFKLKNPPFDVMYDYGYSGGLAVAGSEQLILELMLWALDEGMSFGMHYCSLDNKHRSEMRLKNERAAHIHPCVEFDEEDFFLKTAKVFGDDIEPARALLESAGCADTIEDAREHSLAFAPSYIDAIRQAGFDGTCTLCSLVYELDDDKQTGRLVDVGLEVLDDD